MLWVVYEMILCLVWGMCVNGGVVVEFFLIV